MAKERNTKAGSAGTQRNQWPKGTRARLVVAFTGLFLAVSLSTFIATGAAHNDDHPKSGYNSAGELERPVGYREWVYIGTPLTPNDLN